MRGYLRTAVSFAGYVPPPVLLWLDAASAAVLQFIRSSWSVSSIPRASAAPGACGLRLRSSAHGHGGAASHAMTKAREPPKKKKGKKHGTA